MSSAHWDDRYQRGETPWDTGLPSSELVRVVGEQKILPCRTLELGCGSGANAVWLAQQGFEVTAVDVSTLALDLAQKRADDAGVAVNFVWGDVLNPPDLGAPFAFFFDRGCYHIVRKIDLERFLQTLERLTVPGSLGFVLAGNAKEVMEPGPPTVSEAELRAELGRVFEIVALREFRFDQPTADMPRPLAWSILLRRMR